MRILIRFLYFPMVLVQLLTGCQSNNESISLPELRVNPVTFNEGTGDDNLQYLTAELSSAADLPVTVYYSTREGSALANIDFIPVEKGSITIEKGETSGKIPVKIKGDDLMEFKESFMIDLKAENASIRYGFTSVILLDDDIYIPEKVEDGFISPAFFEGMELIWQDEFNESEVNMDNWYYDFATGFPVNCGWGLEEEGKYAGGPANLAVEDGILKMTATIDPATDIIRTSRVTSNQKQKFRLGRIDIRAKTASGQGLASNIRLIGEDMDENGWPQCGEIGIARVISDESSAVNTIIYSDKINFQADNSMTELNDAQSPSDEFHIYTLYWEEDRVRWFMDGKLLMEVKENSEEINKLLGKSFFVTINLAVGGNFAGELKDSRLLPATFMVDYIRIFKPEGMSKTN